MPGVVYYQNENQEKLPQTPLPPDIDYPMTIWSLSIPRLNRTFMIGSLILVFGLDLIILIFNFALLMFWLLMFLVFVVFCFFFVFENYIFNKRFAKTTSSLDRWLSELIVIRNLVFVLNFLPGIQIFAILFCLYAGIPYLILYLFLIWRRLHIAKAYTMPTVQSAA